MYLVTWLASCQPYGVSDFFWVRSVNFECSVQLTIKLHKHGCIVNYKVRAYYIHTFLPVVNYESTGLCRVQH